MRSSRPTSARCGTLSRISVSSVKRLAIISGRVAFLAPEIGIAPFKGRPPAIRIRSMTPRCLSPFLAFRPTVGNLGLNSGGIVLLYAPLHAPPLLRFAAFEVVAQRSFQTLRAPGVAGLSVLSGHDEGIGAAQRNRKRARQRVNDRIFARSQCCRSSVVEHPLGKGEVECSIHSGSTITNHPRRRFVITLPPPFNSRGALCLDNSGATTRAWEAVVRHFIIPVILIGAFGLGGPSLARESTLGKGTLEEIKAVCDKVGGKLSQDANGFGCGTDCHGHPGTDCTLYCRTDQKCVEIGRASCR